MLCEEKKYVNRFGILKQRKVLEKVCISNGNNGYELFFRVSVMQRHFWVNQVLKKRLAQRHLWEELMYFLEL